MQRELRAIQQEDRAPLRRLGVRFGAFSIFLPALVKPSAARLKALLWAIHQGLEDIPPPPPAGLTSLPTDPSVPQGFYEAAGFRLCGPRAVRLDMLERLGEIIRSKGQGGQMPQSFTLSSDMMSVLGCGEDDMAHVLRSLGFRDIKSQNEAGEEVTQWQQRPRRDEQQQRRPGKGRPHPARQAHDRRPATPAAEGAAVPVDGQPAPEQAAKEHQSGRERQGGKDRRERFSKKYEGQSKGPQRGKPEERGKTEERGKPRPQAEKPQRRPEKPFVVDPDSPFAALAALKFQK